MNPSARIYLRTTRIGGAASRRGSIRR
jgi:hypothetical protein